MELYGAEDKRPLDKCLEDVRACYLYIGIFAWRYGYIPPECEQSITELEYSEAVKTEKSRLLFLLSDDAPWPMNLFEREKYKEIEVLRKRVSEDRIVKYFSSEDQLYAEVTDALVNWEAEKGIKLQPGTIDWEQYKENVKKEHQWVRLNVIAGPRQERITQIPLVEVFVPQLAEAKLPNYDVPDEILALRREFFSKQIMEEWTEESEERAESETQVPEEAEEPLEVFPESIFDVIARERTQVIVGGPGIGKTTLLHYLMLRLVDPERGGAPLPFHVQESAIPFLVEIRQYLLSGKTSLTEYIIMDCIPRYGIKVDTEGLKSLLNEAGRSLVFFDGLDEVFDPADRGRTVQQFKSFALEYPNTQVIVTTRIAGYEPDELQLANFKHYTLLDFNIQQATDFIHKWYAYYTWEGDQRTAAGLIQRIMESPRLLELAGNPLLLTMMAIIYKHQDLPEKRWELYERATSVLLEDWDVKRKLLKWETILPLPENVRMGKDQKAKLLQRISMYMLEHGQSGKELNAIAYPQVMEILTRFLQEEYGTAPGSARDLASEILNYLRERTYILAEIGEHIYGFVHRTFMEYFAASHIRAEFNAKKSDYDWLNQDVFGAHWKQDEWREVLLLFIAMLAGQGSPVKDIVEYLRDSLQEDIPFHKTFAAMCLAETAITGNQPIADSLFVDLAKAIEEHVESRRQQASAFVEEALQAFSVLARTVHPPDSILGIINALQKRNFIRARMAAWQMGFAMQSGQERLNYALGALQDQEEAVRRAAIRVLEREWPGKNDVKQALIEVLQNDRYARVRQAALEVIQRGWPNDAQILEAIESRLDEELPYTYIHKVIDYLAVSWRGNLRALKLVLKFAGCRFKPTDFGVVPDVNEHVVRVIVRSWQDHPEAKPFLLEQLVSSNHINVRLAALIALVWGWAKEPATLAILRDRINSDDYREGLLEVIGLLGRDLSNNAEVFNDLCYWSQSHKDPPVRVMALNALTRGWAKEPVTLAILRDRIINDHDSTVRCAAIAFLAGDFELLSPYKCFPFMYLKIPSLAYVRYSSIVVTTIKTFLGMSIPIFPDIWNLFHGYSYDGVKRWLGKPNYHRELQLQRMGWLDDPETLPFLLDRAATDDDRVVRATAMSYAALLMPRDSKLKSFFEARQEEEPDKLLYDYIIKLADFTKQLSYKLL